MCWLRQLLGANQRIARETNEAIKQMRRARIFEAEARTKLIDVSSREKTQAKRILDASEQHKSEAIRTAKEAVEIIGKPRP